MGVHANLMLLLRDVAASAGFRGRLCTLGVQDFPQGIVAADFYREIGFSEVETLDNSDYEGAEHIVDLNDDALPEHLVGRFDVVFNGGTIEHVFHVPNAMASITSMLKPTGIALHLVPTNGWVDHGFYQVSPTLLQDYYEAARFDPLSSALLSYNADQTDKWLVRPIAPGDLGLGLSGVIDRGIHLYFFAARRTDASITRPIPQQRAYSRKGQGQKAPWFMPYAARDGFKEPLFEMARVTLSDFRRDTGHARIVPLPDLIPYADHLAKPRHSSLILLENGEALGPAHSSHDVVRQEGSGAYSHWNDGLFFSTSDNTDPATNGRRYEAILPAYPM